MRNLFQWLVLLAWIGHGCAAAESNLLTYRQAAQLTLRQHPEMRAFALQQRATEQRALQAALRPALELGVDVEGFGGTGDFQGLDATEFSISLSSIFERGNKRDARGALAQAQRDALTTDQRIATLDILAETARRFVATAIAAERATMAIRRVAELQDLLGKIRPRVAAAATSRTELLDAEISLSQAQGAAHSAARLLQASQMALGAQWNDENARPHAVLALKDLPVAATYESMTAKLELLPDLARFASEARLHEAQLRLRRAEAVTDLRWSVGLRRYGSSDDEALIAGISMPLGGARRAATAVRIAELESEQVSPRQQGRVLALRPLLFSQVQLLANTQARVSAIASVELPKAREMLALIERGYQIGRFPYRELALARNRIFELEAAGLDGAEQYHLTSIEVERLTGAHVDMLREYVR